MRSASSLPRPPRRCSEATLPKCVARPRSRAATRASLHYNLCTVIVDETDAKAQAKSTEYRQYASYDGALCSCPVGAGSTTVNTAPTDLVRKSETNAIISVVDHLAGGGKIGRSRSLPLGWHWRSWAVFVGSRRRSRTFCRNGPKRQTLTANNLAYAVTHETYRRRR